MLERLNGGIPEAAIREIFKQSVLAGVLTIGMCVMFWLVVSYALDPWVEERKVLLDAVTSSVKNSNESNERVTELVQSTADSFKASANSFKTTADYAESAFEAQQAWYETMGAFIKEVRTDHPKMQKTADEILTEVKKPEGG